MAQETLSKFLALCAEDEALKNFAKTRKMNVYFKITDTGDQFYLQFETGAVKTGLGAPSASPDLVMSMSGQTLQGLMSGKLYGESAVMSGQLYVSDEWKAMDLQGIQRDLARLFAQAAA